MKPEKLTFISASQAQEFAKKTPEKEFEKLASPDKDRVIECNERIAKAAKLGQYSVEFDYRLNASGINSLQGEQYFDKIKAYFELCGFKFNSRVNNWPSNEEPPFYSWLNYHVKINWEI